jgi:preprotein translocase subunit SecD
MFKALLLIPAILLMPLKHNYKHTLAVHAKPYLKTGWYYVTDESNNYKRSQQNSKESYFIKPRLIIPVSDLQTLEIRDAYEPGASEIYMKFNARGTNAFRIATGNSINKRLAFIIDDKLIYIAIVNAQINSGLAVINGYPKSELQVFINQIRSVEK